MLTRLLLGSVLTISLAAADNLTVNGIVAFGDSLSDAGNDYIATAKLLGPQNATPQPPNYTTGEFTDGPDSTPKTNGPVGIWLDQLAPKLGVTAPAPSLANGTNFAFGGSQTLAPSGPGDLIPSLNQEVAAALLAFKGSMPSNQLYTFWSGANDIAANVTDPSVAVKAADDIYQQIQTVAAAGGKDFLWLNLPPLGETPSAMSNGSAVQAMANNDSTQFKNEWTVDIQKLKSQGINVIGVDIDGLFQQILDDFNGGCTVGPSDPVCFANITSPAQGNNVDPNTYLFWDTDHPTTVGHELVADAAFAAIEAVPEPASLALAAAGLLGLALIRRRKLVRD